MKAILTILFFGLLSSSNAQVDTTKIAAQYNPLKKKVEVAHLKHLKDTLRTAHKDSVFLGLFYCTTCANPVYAVYSFWHPKKQKWTYIKVYVDMKLIPAPDQVFNVVSDSTIVDPDKAVKQVIKIHP